MDDTDRCGHPTKRGGLCRNFPMNGGERCHLHAGLAATAAQRDASRENPVRHGYFVSGFLDEEERELFEAVLRGEADPGEIRRQVIAALVVRANRITRWEAEGEPVSGFATEVFGELRKCLEGLSPEELRVEHAWDDAEVARQVQEVLAADPGLLVRLLPEEVRGVVEEALRRNSR